MASNFPTSLDSFSTSHADGAGEIIHASTINDLADATNKIEAFIGINGVRRVFDLVGKYGVSTSNTATLNATKIHSAFADAAAVGGIVYLRGSASFYPCNPLTLPRAPITFLGDGPTASVLLADASGAAAPMLSADPNGLPTAPAAFGRVSSDPKQIYDGDLTIIKSLGFNGLGHFVTGVKGISIVNQGGQRGQFLLSEVLVYGTNETGIEVINSGNLWGEMIDSCTVYGPGGIGFDLGSDMMVRNCVAANCGYEGFRSLGYGTSLQIDNCKAFGCGTTTASRGVGLYLGSNGAGISVTNFNAQDNGAEGMVIEDSGSGESHNITVTGLVCDSNSSKSLGTYSGLRLSDCHDVQVTGYVSTDRFYQSQTCQVNGLKVTNAAGGNARNYVQMVQSPTDEGRGYPTMGSPIASASDLTGTYVQVGGSGGGETSLAFAAGGMTPDPYKAQTQVVGTLTANMTGTIAVPTYSHKGCRLRFKFTQDATGGRTLSWAAGYKQSFSTTGNTANKITVVEFEYDGTSWVQVGTNVWV